ncbi:MAG: GDP-mannose-dependent alpha-(1-6)-phosphatidylinositol monomannoside mannosyltransferase [Verrucomicrobia bacterium ADurb.Bin118]|jgi:glycosyltransferase involved in cell wall biosynthesis|nr:MAG: GDP-mannose-dependent alpha-(1-6)-phosphatidylinositol monomannoside mannosyltransferase [Verrucomicrobia bacterium ADurb.Bin118]
MQHVGNYLMKNQLNNGSAAPKTVAWFSFFPVEWLPDAPAEVQALPRLHPASWQRVLLEALARQQPDLRLHIVVLRKQFPRSFSFQRRQVTFHLVRTLGGFRAPSLFWLDTLLIRRVLRQVRPDLVHAWGTENGAALVAARLGYPYLVTVQGLMSWYRDIIPVGVHGHLAAWLERRSLPRAPLVTTESRFSVAYVRQHFPPAPVMQIEHASDWVFHQVQRTPQLNPRRFISVGRFDERKGVDLLLRALDRLVPDLAFELVMVGGPIEPLHTTLRQSLSAELWRRVTFKDKLPPSEVARELATATIMLCPTRADVSPNSVKESVVAGVPVVASAVGGIPDYVIPGENGILFDSGDLDGCVRSIREACAHPLFGQGQVNPDTLTRMRAYLSPETMGHRFLAAYQQVWRNQAKPGAG